MYFKNIPLIIKIIQTNFQAYLEINQMTLCHILSTCQVNENLKNKTNISSHKATQ